MNILLRVLKIPNLIIAMLILLLVFVFQSYRQEYQKNKNLTEKITSITNQLRHYQNEVKRYNDIANLAEQQKQKLEQEREKTATIINQIKNSDACFAAPAPTAIVERLRQQATDSNNRASTNSH